MVEDLMSLKDRWGIFCCRGELCLIPYCFLTDRGGCMCDKGDGLELGAANERCTHGLQFRDETNALYFVQPSTH